MSLEQNLKAGAESWLAGEELSPERSAALERLVRRRRRRSLARWAGMSAAAASLTAVVMMWPMVVAIASGTPWVGPYIAKMARYDEGAYWADQKGYVVPVGKSATDQGITLTVESILADSARTVIYYVAEGPGLDPKKGFPMYAINFNKFHSPVGGSGRSEFVDGRLVGSMEWFGPLPTPVTVVDLEAAEIAGVKGHWSISFMASRVALDRFARVIPVNQKLKGDGFDLTVTRMLLAPTQTVFEIEGSVDPDIQVWPDSQLTADGRRVNPHGGSYSLGGTDFKSRYAFDRIDPEGVSQLTLHLNLIRLRSGGPRLDLRPGARTTDGDHWFEFLGVEQQQSGTLVSVRVDWPDEPTWLKSRYDGWVLVDASGSEHEASVGAEPAGDGTAVMKASTRVTVADPVQIKVLRHAEPVKGDLSVQIELK